MPSIRTLVLASVIAGVASAQEAPSPVIDMHLHAMTWPGLIEASIAIIEEAPFLTEAEARDTLDHNVSRFLRLDDATIARHHGRLGGE